MSETRRFDCDTVTSVPGPPAPAVVVGSGYQWSDDSDDTYAESATPDLASYSVPGAKIRNRLDILDIEQVVIHVRAKSSATSARIGIGLGSGLGDEDNNQGFFGPYITESPAHYSNTVLLPADFEFFVQTMDPYVYVITNTLGTTSTIYDLWFMITGTFAKPAPAHAPPQRIFPREDRLLGGSPRVYPPPRTRQAGNRIHGGYL